MATNPIEEEVQPNLVVRVVTSAKKTVRNYSLPLGALIAGLAAETVPTPFTGLIVAFVVLAVVEYER